jgi:hypothetical protein
MIAANGEIDKLLQAPEEADDIVSEWLTNQEILLLAQLFAGYGVYIHSYLLWRDINIDNSSVISESADHEFLDRRTCVGRKVFIKRRLRRSIF